MAALISLLTAPGPAQAAVSGPCDIYAAAGTPCVAAHSSVRALFSGYSGPLYQVTRASDGATHDIGLLTAGGYANAADQDTFCADTICTITKIYDQTGRQNDLVPGPVGTAGAADKPAVASAIAVTAGGHKAYGIWISPGVGYRYTGVASGVAVGGHPEGAYMVASGSHTGSDCCFDYGNAESKPADTGDAHMDAVSIATTCYFAPCSGSGPWVEADMENGMFQGSNGSNTANKGNASPYVTAMLKNNGQTTYALKGGNSQSGGLSTWWNGPLPTGYAPMHQEGGIILGTGGDNSNRNVGTFFEGVMTAGYPSDATDDAIQANIVAAGYSGQTNTRTDIQTGATTTIVDHNGKTAIYARGTNGQIYEGYQTARAAGPWSGWELNLGTGGPFVSAPSVYVDAAGKTAAAAIDTSGAVEENRQTVAGGGPWSGWHSVSAPPTGVRFVGTPYATKDVNGVDTVYATGDDRQIYETYLSSSAWVRWELSPGTGGPFASSPSVFLDSTGKLVMTAIDVNGNLEETYQTKAGGGPWSGWHTYNNSPMPTGVRFIGTPYSTKDVNGVNVTYVTASNGQIYENYLTSSGWHGWELSPGTGGPFASSPSVFLDSTGKLVMTAIDVYGGAAGDVSDRPGTRAVVRLAPLRQQLRLAKRRHLHWHV